jgi:hypothetical protein
MNCWKNLKMLGKLGVAAPVLAVGIMAAAGCDGSDGDSSDSSSSDVCKFTALEFKLMSLAVVIKHEDAANFLDNMSSLSDRACEPVIKTLHNHPWQPVNVKIDNQKYSVSGNQVSQLPSRGTNYNLPCLLNPNTSQC